MLPNNTSLSIGPLTFTHQVQKINIQERKAVNVLEATRSKKNFIIDSGDSDAKAQIRLLFTGLDEINGTVGLINKVFLGNVTEDAVADLSKNYSISGLRALIALFKCCPIVTIKNNYISSSWKKADKIYNQQNYEKLKRYLEEVTEINANYLIEEQEDAAIVSNNANIVQTLNQRLEAFKGSVTPDILKGVGQFTDYSFGSVNFPDSFLQQNVVHSSNVSVAIESLELENVPDIPYSIQATLTVARIDTAPFTRGGELEYLGPLGLEDHRSSPSDAYWLKKWIYTILDKGEVPALTKQDFKEAKFAWFGQTAIGSSITDKPPESFSLQLGGEDKVSDGLLISENASLRHRFAYNKIIGKVFPTGVHMGSSGRFMSMDIVFNNQRSYETYNKFCRFKYTADEINKERERFDRVTGWQISTPIAKLLYTRRTQLNQVPTDNTYAGTYVPISIITETGDQPDMINCRIDLVENNIDYYSDNEIVLEEGSGTDYSDLEKYYKDILEKELRLRRLLVTNKKEAIGVIVGDSPEGSDLYEAYSTFWPIEKGLLKLKDESGFGILNIDTLRAAILYLDEPKNGGTGELRQALFESPLTSGALFANRRVTLLDSVTRNLDFVASAAFSGSIDGKEDAKKIYEAIRKIVENRLVKETLRPFAESYFVSEDPLTKRNVTSACANLITVGFIGDRDDGFIFNNSTTGKAITLIAGCGLEFTEDFKNALFSVVIQRKPKPKGLPYIYSTDGLYSAFYKLILKYSLDKDKITGTENRPDPSHIVRKNANRGTSSVYPDLFLPTYRQLYGDRWEDFAPTLDDLGIVVPKVNIAGDQERSDTAVSENDYISPAAWFYIKRNKKDLRESLKRSVQGVNDVSPTLSLSVPFNTHEIDRLKQLIKEKSNASKNSKNYDVAEKSINEIITDAFTRYSRTNPSGFREDVTRVFNASDAFEKLINTNQKIVLNFKNSGSYVVPREINIPGLGAEIYRVVTKGKLLELDQPTLLDPGVEATYVTPLNKEAAFLRGSAKSTEACTNSCIDQIGDDHTSPERMFPAIKVYLIDRRGNDLIADDTLFNVNSIISVDITMDKDDAPVAVIKLADPLYFLQNSYFDEKNIQYADKSSNKNSPKIERVFNSLKSADRDSFLKRYKIAQGRAVQIRMGYSSMSFNLPIVFTGRIAEISPGDELVLVCQGWKAELVNRKVNFYNDDTKNWGARDLAIQAITYANPEGFGDFFPEADAQFILKNMDPMDVQLALENVRRNAENVDLEGRGSRDISEGISNWFSTLFTYTSQDKRNVGFDTRLKNIWYPDTQLYSNLVGLRSLFNVMPSWLNDSWVVPLQPSWDVLKEASRHAWNCVVDVVPYDGEATIFMGHPDQPYYYTRGDSYSKKSFKKFSSATKKEFDKGFGDLLDGFLNSDYYNNTGGSLQGGFYSQDSIDSLVSSIALAQTEYQLKRKTYTKQAEFNSLLPSIKADIYASLGILYSPSLKYFALNYTNKAPISIGVAGSTVDTVLENSGINSNSRNIALALFNKSTIPSQKLDELISSGISANLTAYLFSVFYGLNVTQVIQNWNSIKQDLPVILKDIDGANQNQELSTRLSSLVVIPSESRKRLEFKATLGSLVRRVSVIKDATSYDYNTRNKASFPFQVGQNNGRDFDYYKETLEQGQKAYPEFISSFTNALTTLAEIKTESRKVFPLLNPYEISFENQIKFALVLIGLNERIANAEKNIFDRKSIIDNLGLRTDPPDSFLDINSGPENYIIEYLPLFKAFVYYFCSYALETPGASASIQKLINDYDKTLLPPNMKVFRVHHFADDTHNILANNIVASTSEMWNTVVIEHPSPGTANNSVQADSIYSTGTLSAGINWVYWPKQEITGVIGLQFHPGLTLANKKIKVFTELNVQTPDLAAKLACHHLAEGIKKMYRGNLSLLGKHIKPHDRIILADAYTKMVGPVEVESVVHHWNVNQGWVTNVLPNAICESNPASSVLHTAVMESTYQSVFNVLEFVSDVLTYATVIATLGAATPLAVGRFSTQKGLSKLFKTLLESGRTKALWSNYKRRWRNVSKGIANDWRKGSRVGLIKSLYRETGGPINSLLANEVATATAEYGSSILYKHSAISSYVQIGEKAEQLPVIFTPLIFNGNPFTAGLETEDNIWAIGSFGLYYSMKEIQAGASRFIEDFWEE